MSWANATAPAPYGLGLTDEQCWNYTPREYSALEEVRRKYLLLWAIERSDFRNVHFRGENGDVHWHAEQFLGEAIPKKKSAMDHPNVQKALLDHAMGVLPDWAKQKQ